MDRTLSFTTPHLKYYCFSFKFVWYFNLPTSSHRNTLELLVVNERSQ